MQADKNSERNCTRGYSHNKEVLMICLDKECETSRLCCLTCIDEFHRKHELISLFKFQQMLAELDEKSKPHAKDDVYNIIMQSETEFHKELDQSFQRATKQYHDTKVKLNQVFKEVYDMIRFQKSEKSIIDDFYSEFNSKSVSFYLKKVNQTKNKSYQTPESTLATLKKAQTVLKGQIKEFEVGFTKLMEGFTKNIDIIKSALTQSSFVPFSKKFSKINKAQCLQVDENLGTTKRIEGSGGYPINLLQSPVTKENNQISIKIKQEPGNKGIWMGVAILNIVKNNNFLSCFGTGKGTYAIDQVGASHASGFSWNHHDSSFNSQPKLGWQFNLGDTVNIKVNYSNSSVTFTRGLNQYTQPVRLDLGDLYFFAGPTNLNDCLMIV